MKQSYSSAKSMSDGPRPAALYSFRAIGPAGESERSVVPLLTRLTPPPQAAARICTGRCGRSLARSALTTATATAPSVSRQQSKRWNGSTIQRTREVVVAS